MLRSGRGLVYCVSDLSNSFISFGQKQMDVPSGRIRLRLKLKPRSFGEALFLSGLVFSHFGRSWSVSLVCSGAFVHYRQLQMANTAVRTHGRPQLTINIAPRKFVLAAAHGPGRASIRQQLIRDAPTDRLGVWASARICASEAPSTFRPEAGRSSSNAEEDSIACRMHGRRVRVTDTRQATGARDGERAELAKVSVAEIEAWTRADLGGSVADAGTNGTTSQCESSADLHRHFCLGATLGTRTIASRRLSPRDPSHVNPAPAHLGADSPGQFIPLSPCRIARSPAQDALFSPAPIRQRAGTRDDVKLIHALPTDPELPVLLHRSASSLPHNKHKKRLVLADL
ncbi:uncharacterized protein LAESUDRAFT_159012 [Laetiporus sulphureus 93-53]|uniref:Uncharacterized protein n=1 Tax=Laetiporus sulphureus 93-53 TaxID=1314785 RepID=A0A165HMM2_9APHY|nr:uncharacterized protein LAESUDRAFT_159012 [Laetiporus sulphureus 93-53]KZT11934.1 hypothetical protein LAESUDRAFT_159012 [Laetiporus sulphureus 93-53]